MGEGLVRLNIGAGPDHKDGWVNIDNGVDDDIWTHKGYEGKPVYEVRSDIFDYLDSLEDDSVDEVYAGHFLEHFEYGLNDWQEKEAHRLLTSCHRVLKSGGIVGIVVPDMKEVLRCYFFDGRDLDDLCAGYIYSNVQPSQHKWCWDLRTLRRALERAGFEVTDEIDRYEDSRLAAGAFYQCGLEAVKRGA